MISSRVLTCQMYVKSIHKNEIFIKKIEYKNYILFFITKRKLVAQKPHIIDNYGLTLVRFTSL